MTHSSIVHAHFYQPPRENPWADDVEPEPGAAPFSDWNARIAHECYEPFGAARVLDDAGHVVDTINLYEWVNFDVAPTLLIWLERHAAATYQRILDADRASAARLDGHGNAIATPFHHVILPLASRRDKVTEVRWGLADFRRRFGRDAEGYWLPETAADEETLVVLAEAGVRFTILAPQQVENTNLSGAPLRFAAGGGRDLSVFVYDGALAHDVAFGRLLDDGNELARRLAPPAAAGRASLKRVHITSLASDGETFGHHRKFAEMALARAVTALRQMKGTTVENYASVLARVPAVERLQLVEPSSWSCAHGIERWRSGCSCGTPGASHAWRRPLRAALNWLARELDARWATEAARDFADPWAARDAYGAAAMLPAEQRDAFVLALIAAGGDAARARRVLDGARARLGMFGSCAWFFDDATGHETILMLRLAAYAIDALGAHNLEEEFLARLAFVRDARPGEGDAAQAYIRKVVPLKPAVPA